MNHLLWSRTWFIACLRWFDIVLALDWFIQKTYHRAQPGLSLWCRRLWLAWVVTALDFRPFVVGRSSYWRDSLNFAEFAEYHLFWLWARLRLVGSHYGPPLLRRAVFLQLLQGWCAEYLAPALEGSVRPWHLGKVPVLAWLEKRQKSNCSCCLLQRQ